MKKYVLLPLSLVLFTAWKSFSETTLYGVCGRKDGNGGYVAVNSYGAWSYKKQGEPTETNKQDDCNSALTRIILQDQKPGGWPQAANYRYKVGNSTSGGGPSPSPFDCGGTYRGRTYRCLLSSPISFPDQHSEFMARALAGSGSGTDYKNYYKCLTERDLDSCLSLLKTCTSDTPYKNTYNTANCNKFNNNSLVIDALFGVLDKKGSRNNTNLSSYRANLASFTALSYCNGHKYAYNKAKSNQTWATTLFPMYKPHYKNYDDAVRLSEWYTHFGTGVTPYTCTRGQHQNKQLYEKGGNKYYTTGYTESNNKYYPTSWKQL